MGEMQMQRAKYTAEFKEEAVRQVIDRGHSVIDVAKRQLQMLSITESEIKRLQAQMAIAQTARISYANALKAALPAIGGSDTIKL